MSSDALIPLLCANSERRDQPDGAKRDVHLQQSSVGLAKVISLDDAKRDVPMQQSPVDLRYAGP